MTLPLSAPLDVEDQDAAPAFTAPLDVEDGLVRTVVGIPCLSPWSCSCGLPEAIHYDFHGPAIIAGDPAYSTGLKAGLAFEWVGLDQFGRPVLLHIPAPANLDESAKWSSAGAPPPDWAKAAETAPPGSVLAAGAELVAALDQTLAHAGDLLDGIDQAEAHAAGVAPAAHHLKCDQCDATTTLGPRPGFMPTLSHDFTGTHSVQWRPADWGEPGSVAEAEPISVEVSPASVIDWSQVGEPPPGQWDDAPTAGALVVHSGRIEPVPLVTVTFEAPMILGRDGNPLDPKAEAMRERMIAAVRAYAANDPRTTQVDIGPSEIGDPCDARVLRAALGFEPSNQPDPWASFVGQATHAKLADVFLATNNALGRERYLIERRVYVTDGIYGTTDLAECRDDGTLDVIDHKIVGTDTYKLFTRRKEGGWLAVPKYATQLDLYALAWKRGGRPPATVNLAIWPRSGFLDGLMIFQREPDYANAEAALDRMSNLVEFAVKTEADTNDEPWADIPTVAGKGCGFCPWFQGLAEGKSRFACPEGAKYASDARAGTGPRGVAA